MDESLYWAVLSSVFMWTTLYNIVCLLNPQQSYEWNSRIVTFIHGVVLVTLSGFFGFLYNPWPFTHPGGKTTIYETLTMILCIGYFIFDIFWCIYFFENENLFMIFHHAVTILGIFGSLYTERSGTEVNASIFGSEMSNPMLQIRWFMRETGKKYSAVYELNDFIFMFTFLMCRMVFGSYFMYCELVHPEPLNFFKVGSVCLWLVSLVFAVQIVNFAVFKYTKMYRRWRSKQSIFGSPEGQVVGEQKNADKVVVKSVNGLHTDILNGGNGIGPQHDVRKRFMQNGN
ncbi:TLC domain-containing protein 5-like [Antedon mediterranea]|uniref:TLC domain-containing protein 5-like n=1 Tax=Antedon mediterranea TaxID=105859 RepID=UPI003AF7DB47